MDNQFRTWYEQLSSGREPLRARAVSEMYDFFQPLLFKRMRYKFSKLSSSDIDDIIQESFLKIYTAKSLPENDNSLRPWVMTIAVNSAYDLFRKAYKKNELEWPEDDSGDDLLLEVSTRESVNEMTYVDEDGLIAFSSETLNRDVERCVSEGMLRYGEKFPDRETAISLSLDGYSIQEIADVFQRTEQAMRQFIYESRKKLAPFIEQCVGELELKDG